MTSREGDFDIKSRKRSSGPTAADYAGLTLELGEFLIPFRRIAA
jgi:hypothetical protein